MIVSVKRIRPSLPRQVPIDDDFVYVPVGADAIDGEDVGAGYASFEFPCHPRMLAGLILDVALGYQVWEQACPACGRLWRFTRSERLVRWEPIRHLLDPTGEQTVGIDAWEALVERYRSART